LKNLLSIMSAVGVVAMTGCAVESGSAGSEQVGESIAALGSATLTYQSDNGTSYCATVTMTNGLTTTASKWQAAISLQTNTITSVTNAKLSGNTGNVVATPTSTVAIAPGGNASFSFCANASSSAVRPSVTAWNMDSAPYATCTSNSGLNPTKAALAVAMAKELGRWNPTTDLTITGTRNTPSSRVVLSAAGLAACTNGCANTKAILGQQDASFVDQNMFSQMNYISDLAQSFDRQNSLLTDLSRNNPAGLPPAHKLTLVAGPVNLNLPTACGPHYIFQADTTAGVPLTTAQANAMVNTMCFYGAGSCGSNTYIGFQVTQANGCPAGKSCIAIDPTDGDNGSTSTTTAGSAPTYPMNRVYDPTNALLGTQCITTTSILATLKSNCATKPLTCGYLYCM